MWYVYITRSIPFPKEEYTGATSDLDQIKVRWNRYRFHLTL